MTALCGGGASGAKPGVSETIIFTAGSLSSLLNNKGGYWATLAAPLLGVVAYSATSLCGTDPPAEPTITSAEYTALLQLAPWDDLTTALGKLADIVKRVVWFDMCECTSVATPALPTDTLAPPAGVTLPTYGGSGVFCPQPRGRLNVPLYNGGVPVPQYTNVTRDLFPGLPIYQSVGNANFDAQDIIVLPTNWTSLCSQVDLVSGTTGASSGYGVQVNAFTAARTFLPGMANNVVTNASPHSIVGTGSPGTCSSPFVLNHTTMHYLSVNVSHAAASPTDGVVDFALTINCTGDSGSSSDCCSDPAVLALLGHLMSQVNLIQRQSVPFAYVTGATHAGLTGTGTIDVQGLIGALARVTATSVLVGEEAGTPEQLFEAGWIAWGNADGFSAREFISNAELVSLPAAAGQYTRIAYTLPPGLVLAIDELVREA